MKRVGSARWNGTLREGRGTLASASGVLEGTPYSFGTRFGEDPGTNPEELIAAAHAGCFSMSLVYHLEEAGVKPKRIETTAELTLTMGPNGPDVNGVHLRVVGAVPGMSSEDFQRVAERAKEVCLVSRLLRTTTTLEASVAHMSQR